MKGVSSHNGKLRKITKISAFFAVVIIAGLVLPRVFTFVGALVLTPVQALNQWYETSEQQLPVLLRDKSTLSEEIKSLENELIVARSEDLTRQRLQDENNRLRRLLNAESDNRILARVIARPNQIPYDFLQIDRGTQAGIQENSLVYVGSDQLIGVVSEVRNNHSFVQLFTSPGIEMTGFVSGPDVVSTIEGIGGGVARIRVPQGIPIAKGNLVYVPSVEPGAFGQIDFVENRPSQPEQFGYITLQIPLQSLHEVAVSDEQLITATPEVITTNKEKIIRDRLLREETHTVSFEELNATSTATSTETDSNNAI